ncbi:adenylate/guanylate cyclase domain-containing protein [Leptospira yasudae]|uniref:Adenylate/guanylate cyclase domain-containing protein n=1 Tax=Leptospira yasudae TaxID=2202201 RepID=A0A6N4QV95_9LEPT|nr:adenylate/guanylate cyclase domain-containing protein [Leptospira yasudae]TGL78527.1 adenylate/guanylate cyclase domain-containing protein [Leptospira yasudae]TGL79834.1 adenylate/guanylate cyclase domain-containing protein [Leptospira yasudae]TGL85819.1 adenylate/guanylate cyclase domain-containing protein [Leptospira yasudae]
MIRILKLILTASILSICISCATDPDLEILDLTQAEWKASLGNHLKTKLEKSNFSGSNSQTKRKNKERESSASENWKTISGFPAGLNSLFGIPEQSGFHDVTVTIDFSIHPGSQYLKLPAAIYFPDIGENWELYLNGVLIRKERFPEHPEQTADLTPVIRRSLKSVTLPIPSGTLKEGKNTILVYLIGESNLTPYIQNDHFGFYHASGYRISSFQQIYESTSEYFEVFLYGIYFIFGIYHILFYITRRQDLYYLYFGLFSFASSVYFFSSSNLIFQKFVNSNSNIDSSLFFRAEYASLTLILPSFYYFLKEYFYPKEKAGIVPLTFVVLSIGLFLGVLASPFSWTHIALKVCQVSMIFFLFYILYFSIQTVRRKKQDAKKMLAGIAACIVFAVWDLLDSIFKIIGLHYPFFKIAYSLFIITIISILVSRYIQLYKDAQLLNKELSNQKDAFYRFVPADFIRILDKESPVSIAIGDNKEKSMTVLFSDIRNFTSISEAIQPSQTIAFLNSYLSEMEDLVYQTAGFVDKYVGDAVLALFADYNERVEKENFNSADNAVESAIKMVNAVQSGRMQEIFSIPSPWNLEIGVGINTGSLILGTVGSERRIDTTVIGDAVNLASRLQSLTSLYQSRILISHHTYLQLHRMSEVGIRMIDTVFVKGRNQPVDIYEVFESDPDDIKEFKLKTSELLSQGISEYKSGKFDDASKIFKQLYREEARDNLSKIYLKRCKLYSSKPPEENWDGIFRFQTK